MASIQRDFPGLATAIDNYEDTGRMDSADCDLRFRLNEYRPSHGGFYHPFAGDASGARIGSLKVRAQLVLRCGRLTVPQGDMVRAVHESRGGYYTSSPSLDTPLDYMFAALACGTYGNSAAPDALVFALSKHYPVKTLSASHLDKSDAEVLRILRAAEKYGYRVSLAQLELSHFGNPSNRHLRDPSPLLSVAGDASYSEMAGVRAIQARLSAFRDPSGIRIFSTNSEMLLADDSVLNSDVFWSASPAQRISHWDTTEGLGAYYDIEHKFFRTAVVLWRNEDVGSVMLKRSSGAADVMRHLSLVASVVKMLSPDAIDPVLDDALLLLEAPKKTWRKVYGREAARDALATLVLRIAACRGADWVCTRVLEALRD